MCTNKSKSNRRYRYIIGGAASPRKELPNTDVIDALHILEKIQEDLDMVSINMRNNPVEVLTAVQQNDSVLQTCLLYVGESIQNNLIIGNTVCL